MGQEGGGKVKGTSCLLGRITCTSSLLTNASTKSSNLLALSITSFRSFFLTLLFST